MSKGETSVGRGQAAKILGVWKFGGEERKLSGLEVSEVLNIVFATLRNFSRSSDIQAGFRCCTESKVFCVVDCGFGKSEKNVEPSY